MFFGLGVAGWVDGWFCSYYFLITVLRQNVVEAFYILTVHAGYLFHENGIVYKWFILSAKDQWSARRDLRTQWPKNLLIGSDNFVTSKISKIATIGSSVTPTVTKRAASVLKMRTWGSFFDPESQKIFLDKHQQKNTPKITTCSTWSSMNSNSETSEKWFLIRVKYWSVSIHTAFYNINVQATLKNKIMCTWHSCV